MRKQRSRDKETDKVVAARGGGVGEGGGRRNLKLKLYELFRSYSRKTFEKKITEGCRRLTTTRTGVKTVPKT